MHLDKKELLPKQQLSDCRQSPAFAGFCYFVGTAFLI